MTTSLGYNFSQPDNSHKEREKLKPESNANQQKTNYNWTITVLTNYKHLALSKTREHVKGMSGPCGHCALCGNHGKHNISMVPCVSQIMGKNKTSPQPKIDMRQPWYLCSDLLFAVKSCVLECSLCRLGTQKSRGTDCCVISAGS